MRLEDIAAEVRPRHPWEAIDLGFSMVRAWWRPVFGAWLAVVVPFALIVNVVGYEALWLAALIVWWLKPFYDRIVLHVLSRAMFGDAPTVGETLRALPGLLLHSRLLLALTLYRFDPARAFSLPVWQLEGSRGKRRRERSRVLGRNTHGTAVGLMFACINLEIALLIGLVTLVLWLIPDSVQTHLDTLTGIEHRAQAVQAGWNLLYLIAMSAIEPFYVAGGFALYLNRRTLLEGWDIEIAFRRIASRAAEPESPGGARSNRGPGRFAAAWLLAALVGLSAAAPAPTQAAPADAGAARAGGSAAHGEGPSVPKTIADPNRQQAKDLIKDVLAQPAFRTWRKVKRWHYIGGKAESKPDTQTSSGSSWSWLGKTLALMGETLLWVGAAVLIAMLIVNRRRWLALFGRGARLPKRADRPDVLFGMDVRPESLPEDIASTAWRLWREGRAVEAISLLYRGALTTLIDRDGLEVDPGATEGDCLRLVEQRPGGRTAGYFAQLTRAWQRLAYAHRTPADDEAQQLCENWPRYFEAVTKPAGGAGEGAA
ncbi:MAG TPA: DUF4129 domain-containing protein [Gammaproteobacteria bacterium]|nr:DUF4129 domain-containing protein [Gammaproteobacteria bacterium]